MTRDRINFLFLNAGHFLDHLFMLIFATVAALALAKDWGMSYAELIPYATPGFVVFGLCAVPAGWVADKWSREGMTAIFFVGIGLSSILTACARTPLEIGAGLLLIGAFAAIYHPVGLAMVVQGRKKTGVPLALNGIFGNMGVACAALLTGLLIDAQGWRAAFAAPGGFSVAVGVAYALFVFADRRPPEAQGTSGTAAKPTAEEALPADRKTLLRVFSIIFFTTAIGGLIFQSTTFALPKVFAERLQDLAGTATAVGSYAFIVFAVAALAQLAVGYLVDRHSARTVFALVAALQAFFFAVMLLATGVGALLAAIGFMLVVFGQIPINDVLIGRITRSEWRSRIYALRYVVTITVMASSVPLIAWLHANRGFNALFVVLAVAACCILAAVVTLPRVRAITGQ